jgi:hypothetical protein
MDLHQSVNLVSSEQNHHSINGRVEPRFLYSKDSLDKVVSAWESRLSQLRDLLNMKKIEIDRFLMMFSLLDDWAMRTTPQKQSLESKDYNELMGLIEGTRKTILELSLSGSLFTLDSIKWRLESKKIFDEELKTLIDDLIRRIIHETSDKVILAVPINRVEYYKLKEPFLLKGSFEKHSSDINEDYIEAGNCYTLARYTACVFHLMRVMEKAVQFLGKKLRIKIDSKNETWYQILSHVNKAIDKVPVKTARQKNKKAKYATASAHLDDVRIVWRNEVMHPKQTYTPEEAKDLLNAVRIFMNDLIKLL